MPFDACSRINSKLSAYIDGELPARELAEVKEHLSACSGCTGEFRRLSAVDAVLKRLPGIEPNPFFAAKVAAAARALKTPYASLRLHLRIPIPAMAVLVTFVVLNLFTFAFNINAMENGTRRELARKVVAQLVKPASLINPVAVARLCGECSKYMCLCMHEAGKKSLCPCKDCEMERMGRETGPEKTEKMEHMEKTDVR